MTYDEIINTPGSYAFIAIDFSNKFRHVYDTIIYPAVIDAGMIPVKMDQVLSNSEPLVSQLTSLIRCSSIVIADMTFVRQKSFANVFLEIGIAMADNRPIVLLTQEDEFPFDVNHLRTLRYNCSDMKSARESLTSILRENANPAEYMLKKMLGNTNTVNYVIFGQATSEHKSKVYPPVSNDYEHRLSSMSSEASGISQLTVALQKVAWSMGRPFVNIISADGHRAPDDIFEKGNVFIFGGPGANPFFNKAVELANSKYSGVLSIMSEQLENGKKRYFIAKDGEKYPRDQYSLYEQNKDIGFIMRFPNPNRENALIMVAAGLRSFGTEASIKLLVTPSLISKMSLFPDLDDTDGFWALVEAGFDRKKMLLEDVKVIDTALLTKKQ